VLAEFFSDGSNPGGIRSPAAGLRYAIRNDPSFAACRLLKNQMPALNLPVRGESGRILRIDLPTLHDVLVANRNEGDTAVSFIFRGVSGMHPVRPGSSSCGHRSVCS
jgi:hypothetical protein